MGNFLSCLKGGEEAADEASNVIDDVSQVTETEGNVTNITNDVPNDTDVVSQGTEVSRSDSENQLEDESKSDNYYNQENSSESNYDPQLVNNQQNFGTSNVSEIQDPDKLKETVESMRKNAKEGEAAANMLYDFEEMKEDHSYFTASNNEGSQHGIMSIKEPPQKTENSQELDFSEWRENESRINYEEVFNKADSKIDNSVWVEGLVADQSSGLGGKLLEDAEKKARDDSKAATALAAYEFDPKDRDLTASPYSVAGYYEKKGYSYSGQAKEEVDDEGNSHFYPIYYKDSAPLDTHDLADGADN
jgi:hypothetical protein